MLRKRTPYRATVGRDLGDYLGQVALNYAAVANPFAYYIWLIDELRDLPRSEIVPVSLAGNQPQASVRRIAVRHDVDADAVTAVRCARHLARLGIPGSFYLLHTAPYYGDFHGDLFVRNSSLLDWIRQLIVAGCEIGLHIDPLGVIQGHGIDGVGSVLKELEWLRAQGANIQGTVAHNSAPAYGAENYEIFRELVLWKRKVHAPDGRHLPLGTTSFSEAGISYEGTWAMPRDEVAPAAARSFVESQSACDLQSEPWVRQYLVDNPICDWGVDCQSWIIGPDRWAIGGRGFGETVFEFGVNGARMIEVVDSLPEGARILFVLHPAYFRL